RRKPMGCNPWTWRSTNRLSWSPLARSRKKHFAAVGGDVLPGTSFASLAPRPERQHTRSGLPALPTYPSNTGRFPSTSYLERRVLPCPRGQPEGRVSREWSRDCKPEGCECRFVETGR